MNRLLFLFPVSVVAIALCGCAQPGSSTPPLPAERPSQAELQREPQSGTQTSGPLSAPSQAKLKRESQPVREVLFQASTMDALLRGVYDGELTCGELKERGDFGIGTFNGLDGEMIMLEGKVYRVGADGVAVQVDDSTQTPFANVTFFDLDRILSLNEPLNFAQLEQRLDALLPTMNIFYAIRIEGMFKYLKTRSVPRQQKPYPDLLEVVKTQTTFKFQDVRGTIVGFRSPPYAGGIGVPGYHLHFLTEDRKAGGHVLELLLKGVTVEIDYTSELQIVLPSRPEFYGADLTAHEESELEKVER